MAGRDSNMPVKPFIKWAGGKGQILPEIRKVYPKGLGIDIRKYAEPFVGGGAVLFDVLSSYDITSAYICDINRGLINTYEIIRDRVYDFMELLSSYEWEYDNLDEDRKKSYYYDKRDYFNKMKTGEVTHDSLESAAIFIFLNKTCYNGLYRVNRKGHFNVPFGFYDKATLYKGEDLLAISYLLQNVEIVCGDYRSSSDFIDRNTFVYIDPPYRPLNKTSGFTSYDKSKFDDHSQKELADYVKILTDRGAKVVISNSDPKNADLTDDFFDSLYFDYNIMRIKAPRSINSKAELRGKINELLICNF